MTMRSISFLKSYYIMSVSPGIIVTLNYRWHLNQGVSNRYLVFKILQTKYISKIPQKIVQEITNKLDKEESFNLCLFVQCLKGEYIKKMEVIIYVSVTDFESFWLFQLYMASEPRCVLQTKYTIKIPQTIVEEKSNK